MLNNLRHRVATWLLGRSYLAAAGGRRGSSIQSMMSPISAAHASRATIAARARYAVSNNPLAAAALMAATTQTIGTGIKAQSAHADESIRTTIDGLFAAWVDVADDEGRTDWFGIQAALYRSFFVNGEGLAVMLNGDDGLKIRVVDAEQLDASYTTPLSDGARVVQGVEFDRAGRRTGYHIFDNPAGLDLMGQRTRRRVPSADVIQLFEATSPGQVRGVSKFAPVMIRLADLDGWHDGQAMRQRVSSLTVGFITSPDGTASPFEGEQSGSTVMGDMSPGAIRVLDPGQDFKQSAPAQIGMDVVDFGVTLERSICAGLGLPAHVFGDVTRANYSSLKQATTAWKARTEATQWHTFIPQVCMPVWRRFIATIVLSGKISTTIDAALPVKHTCPAWPSLEPLKESSAAAMDLASGVTSRRALISARGEDYEQVMREIAADKTLEESLGLTFGTPVASNDNTPAADAA